MTRAYQRYDAHAFHADLGQDALEGPIFFTSRSLTFQHAMVIGGQVAGTWRTARRSTAMAMDAIPLRKLTLGERRALTVAARRYERFVTAPVEFSIK